MTDSPKKSSTNSTKARIRDLFERFEAQEKKKRDEARKAAREMTESTKKSTFNSMEERIQYLSERLETLNKENEALETEYETMMNDRRQITELFVAAISLGLQNDRERAGHAERQAHALMETVLSAEELENIAMLSDAIAKIMRGDDQESGAVEGDGEKNETEDRSQVTGAKEGGGEKDNGDV